LLIRQNNRIAHYFYGNYYHKDGNIVCTSQQIKAIGLYYETSSIYLFTQK